jgi:hypothetical protein
VSTPSTTLTKTTSTSTTSTSSSPCSPSSSSSQQQQQAICSDPANAGKVICLDVGNAIPDPDALKVKKIGESTIQKKMTSAGSCPAPIQVDLVSKLTKGKYYFSYQPFCDAAPLIKPIVLACASIAALYIIAPALKV